VADGRRWHLFRLEANGERQVELIEVTRGFEEGDRVEILAEADVERPLREGDRIVVTGASSLDDGSAVQVLGERADEGEAEPAEAASNERPWREGQGAAA
jgi:hypothetical protein